MSPQTAGNNTPGSSRRSSDSSTSTPFATPPSSPRTMHNSRIPKPTSSNPTAIPGPSASSRSAKARSQSASAGAGNGLASSASSWRTAHARGVLQPASSSGTRRPSLPGIKTDGIAKSAEASSIGSSAASNVKLAGLGLADAVPKMASRVPTVQQMNGGASAVAGSSSGISRTPGPASSRSPAPSMKRTKSAEGSRSKTTTESSSREAAAESAPSPRVPRRQRSASSLPRRAHASPRAPMPPIPSTHAATKTPPMAPSISISQPTPLRAYQQSSRIPLHHSSQTSPTATTTGRRRSPRTNTPTSKTPPATIDLTDDAPGPLDDIRPTRPNGFGRHKSSGSPRSSAPGSRAASRNTSPSRSSSKSGSPALSAVRQRGSPRSINGSPGPSPRSPAPPLPDISRRSKIPPPTKLPVSRKQESQHMAPRVGAEPSPFDDLGTSSAPGPYVDVPPSSFGSGRSRGDSDATATPGVTPHTSPRRKGSALPMRSPGTSPRRDRKQPGLTIAPPHLDRQNSRRISMPPPVSKPSPPVPAKSPLRALGAPSSRRSSRSLASSPVPPTSPVPPVPPLPNGSELSDKLCLVPDDYQRPVTSDDMLTESPIEDLPSSISELSESSQTLPSFAPSSSSLSVGGGSFVSTPSRSTTPNPTTPTPSASYPSASQAPPASQFPHSQPSPGPTSPPTLPTLSMSNTNFGTPVHDGSEHDDASSSADCPSPYSQDSAPPSAPASSVNLWAIGAGDRDSDISSPISESDVGRSENEMEEILNDSAMYAAQKRTSNLSGPRPKRTAEPITPVGPKFEHNKALPRTPHTPTTPGRPITDPQMRSPSMPTMGSRPAGTMPNGLAKVDTAMGSPSFPRSRTGPVSAGGLQPAPVLASRPQSMVVSTSTSASPSPLLSRRAHLIREIAHTERSHATDLALIRDAYLGRMLRPDSQHSQGTSGASIATSLGESTSTATTPTTPAQESRHSRRSSSYGGIPEEGRLSGYERNSGYERTSGYLVEKLESRTSHDGGKRGSGHERRASGIDSAWTTAWNGLVSPTVRSPREATHHPGGSIDSLYGGSSGAASNSSLHVTSPLMSSPRIPSTPSSANGFSRMGAAPGRPLSQQDIKTIFINISQLAQISDELATQFENALGSPDDEVASLDGEGGSDRMGEVFSRALHRLRPLYTQYCSRHTVAHQRLIELQGDPATAAYLNDCWLKVKAHTHAWNLDSMLIKPVQRITKYPLLFEDLLASTTPAHPDYYAIRASAEGARALALEIDEVKRRKDVISSVMGKSTSSISLIKDNKSSGPGGRLLGLRRFKKDKGNGSGSDPLALLDISPYAQAQLKDLVTRLQRNQENIRKLEQQVAEWREACKQMVLSDMELNKGFIKWHSLRSRVTNDPRLERIAAYQGVLDSLINQSWEELNRKIDNSVLSIMGKLLESTKNPLIVVDRLNRKSAEYARYVAHRLAKKNIERILMQEATEYVSIHTQLLEELPAFLEGWKRIFDLAMGAFTKAQAEYYESIRDRLVVFSAQYLSEPIEEVTDGNGIKAVPLDISTPRGLHKAWHASWHEPHVTIRSLEITGGDGSRSGTMRSTPKFPSAPWEKSPRVPLVSPAVESESSSLNHLAPPASGSSRRRSMSLMAPPQSTTPLSEQSRSDSASGRSVVGLFRRNSHRDSSSRKGQSSRRSSKDDASGLISKVFPGNGNGNDSRSATPATVSTPATPNSASPGLLNRHSHNQLRQARDRDRDRDRPRSRSTLASLTSETSQEEKERHSFGLPRIPTDGQFLDGLGVSPLDSTFSALGLGLEPITPRSQRVPQHQEDDHDQDPGETWRASKVLYACAAVADFNPKELGDQKFKGLAFLPIMAGDLVDVFHEIGRVADLTDFPYSQVGVENDGAVVGRAENGMIGVAMCSFLEPLRAE